MSRARDRADGNAPTGSVEGTDIAFLENASGQDLSGTYSTERMYLAGRTGSAPNDYNYKLTGNVTVTGHLALGSIADSDVVITNDSTEREITGSGLLESGRLMNGIPSLTGMTGELGSVVTGSPNLNLGNATFPAGHVLQVKYYERTTAFYLASPGTDWWTTAGLTACTIDPISSSNYLMVNLSVNSWWIYSAGGAYHAKLKFTYNASDLTETDFSESPFQHSIYDVASGNWNQEAFNYQKRISMPSANVVTIIPYFQITSSQETYMPNGSGTVSVTLWEIKA